MNKYVIYYEFQIEDSNINFSSKFGRYYYQISNNKLSVIYSKKGSRYENITSGFDLDATFYGLIGLISLAFEIRCSTSRIGYSSKNSSHFDNVLKTNIEYSKLYKQLRGLQRINTLNASHKPLGFEQTAIHEFNIKHINLSKNIIADLTRVIDNTLDNQQIFTLLDYWRRGFDLSELNYEAEGFLNYFKIIEHILKDIPLRKLTDDYIKEELRKIRLTSITNRICFYRDLRNKFNIGHCISEVPQQNSYDEYLNNMTDWIWNHESDIAQVAKLLILRNFNFMKYFLQKDGGLHFVNKRS